MSFYRSHPSVLQLLINYTVPRTPLHYIITIINSSQSSKTLKTPTRPTTWTKIAIKKNPINSPQLRTCELRPHTNQYSSKRLQSEDRQYSVNTSFEGHLSPSTLYFEKYVPFALKSSSRYRLFWAVSAQHAAQFLSVIITINGRGNKERN